MYVFPRSFFLQGRVGPLKPDDSDTKRQTADSMLDDMELRGGLSKEYVEAYFRWCNYNNPR